MMTELNDKKTNTKSINCHLFKINTSVKIYRSINHIELLFNNLITW